MREEVARRRAARMPSATNCSSSRRFAHGARRQRTSNRREQRNAHADDVAATPSASQPCTSWPVSGLARSAFPPRLSRLPTAMLQWRLRKIDALTVAGAVPGLRRERYAMRTGFPFQPDRRPQLGTATTRSPRSARSVTDRPAGQALALGLAFNRDRRRYRHRVRRTGRSRQPSRRRCLRGCGSW